MSGYNAAEVRLQRVAQAINNARSAQRKACDSAAAFTEAVKLARVESESSRAGNPELAIAFNAIEGRISVLADNASKLTSSARSLVVPSQPSATSEDAVSALLSRLGEIERSVEVGRAALRDALREVSALCAADSAVSDSRSAILAAESCMASRKEEFSRWLPEEYGRLDAALRAVRAEVAALAGMSASEASATSQAIAAMAAATAASVAALSSRTDDLLDSHERRLYTLRGLRDVCKQLGFKEIDGPRRDDESRPESPIVMKIDTLSRGTVLFRLTMDQQIETDSAIEHHFCATEFSKLSQALDDVYGVQTHFTNTEGRGNPELRKKGAKDLPDDSPAASRAEQE